MIDQLRTNSLSKWRDTSIRLENQQLEISSFEQKKNEAAVEAFRKEMAALVQQIPGHFANQEKWKQKIVARVKLFEGSFAGNGPSRLDYFLELGYGEVTSAFLKKVNAFDPKLDVYDTFQAIRNVWIMNSIQILYGMEVKLTPSIFAYSLMYPYSDNYLDDPTITHAEKKAFNSRFQKWLLGEKAQPSNEREERLYQLVAMVEDEFERRKFPKVYESLLAIHAAQEKSLSQQSEQKHPSEEEILAISIEKGGASVLADAFLVRGEVYPEEAQYLFDYGVFLQLIDDLQDVEEDLAAAHLTIFTQQEQKEPLDFLTNRLKNFIDAFSRRGQCFPLEQAEELKAVISQSSLLMLDEAIAQNQARYNPVYYKMVEKASSVRLAYLAGTRQTFQESFSAADLMKIFRLFK